MSETIILEQPNRNRLRGRNLLRATIWGRPFVILLMIICGCVGLLSIKYDISLRTWFMSSRHRPLTGSDFELMKIVFNDLYDSNSKSYHLAGQPAFPINTDTLRFLSTDAAASLQEMMRSEALNAIAYGARPEHASTKTFDKAIPTNRYVRITDLVGKRRIVKVQLRSTDSTRLTHVQVSMVPHPPEVAKRVDDTVKARQALRLFNKFLKLKKNGYSPFGSDSTLTYDQLANVYGFGQCDNLSHALVDLFNQNGIMAKRIALENPSHSLVEANLDDRILVAFDPYLSTAFLNPDTGEALSFLQVASDVDKALEKFCPSESLRAKGRYFYRGTVSRVEKVAFYQSLERSFDLQPTERAEYSFNEMYPWVTLRNISLPPDGAIGFFKKTTTVKPASMSPLDSALTIRGKMPFPIVDAEVSFLTDAEKPEIYVGEQEKKKVSYDYGGNLTRLRRYIDMKPEIEESGVLRFQRDVNITFDYSRRPQEIRSDINLTLISQISALSYYLISDGYIKVVADQNTNVFVTTEYLD